MNPLLSQICKDNKTTSVYSTHVSTRRTPTKVEDYDNPANVQKLSVGKNPKLKGAKEMVIDFLCREDLVLTTLKEFFEIFVSSIKKEQVFHSELLSSKYEYIGLTMDFNTLTSVATLRILLAQEVE